MDTIEGEKLSRDLGRSQRGKENKRKPPSGSEPSAAARPSSTKPGPGQRRGGARPKLSSLSTGQEDIGGEALGSTSAKTSPRQDDTVGPESGLSSTPTSTSMKGRGKRGTISSPTTSTPQNKMVEDEIIPSSKSTSTTKQKRRPVSSKSFRQEETREDRSPQSSLPTLTRQEDTANMEREMGAAAPSTASTTSTVSTVSTVSTASEAKKSEMRVRAKLSSASKSTSLGDRIEDRQDFSATKSTTPEGIEVEDCEDNSASTRTQRNKGRGAKAKPSSSPSSTRQDETEERLEKSSCSALRSPKDDCLEMPGVSLSLTLKATDPPAQAKLSFKDASATQKSRKEKLQRSDSLLSARDGDTGGEAEARAKLSSESTSAGQERSAAGTSDRSRTPALAREDSLMTPRRRKLNELKLIKEAEEVMRKAGIEISANPTTQGNDFFDEEVKLEMKEKLHTLSQCTLLRENILESLNTGSAWRWKVFNSGSSYDGTKVARSDEMDFMFAPVNIITGWMEVVLDGAPPCFCFLRLRDLQENDPRYTALKQLCDDDRMFIKAASFKENIFKLFRTGIKNTNHAEAGRASAAGAALPAKYHVIPRSDGQGLDPISLDLVPALHFTAWPKDLTCNLNKLPDNVREDVEKAGFHVVPKQYPGAGFKDDRDFLWRLSFSAAEKQMTKYADGKHRDPTSNVLTTCRKYVLRMVKRILEIAKDVDNSRNRRLCPSVEELKKAVRTLREQRCVDVTCFSTFQIRTLLWDDFYIRLLADEHWERIKWRTRLQETLGNLKHMLTGEKQVSHFFVPEMNIVELVPTKEKEFLYIIFLIAEKIF